MFNVMADNNQNITASQDGAIYDVFSGHQNFIIAGIGDEFELTSNTTSLQVSVGTGEAIISGRHISATQSNSITLTASTTSWLCLRIDLTQPQGNEGKLVALTSDEAIENQNLNGGGTVCDILLYKIITSVNGVSSTIDNRRIIESPLISTIKTITIQPSQWQDKQYTLNDPLITATSNQEWCLPVYNGSSDDDMFDAIDAARIRSGGQSAGKAIIKCQGDVPTIAIKLDVIFRGVK